MEVAIQADGLVKRYDETAALDGFDLTVRTGSVHGLLGPNGAGKTTAVRVFATLTRQDAGTAVVAGADVRTDPLAVRRRIGLAGQYAAVDEILTGRQNLVLFGRLFHLGGSQARSRAQELLDQFELADAAGKAVKHYSGGMRRRLDLATSMILAPQVMFLDEPTTGLDPRGRNEVWDAVRGLVQQGTTILLTTQYLQEADELCDHISVIDRGIRIADGTPSSLKNELGGDQVEVVVADAADLDRARQACAAVATGELLVREQRRTVTAPVADRVGALTAVASRLQADGVDVEDIAVRRPTLDEVFLRLTGHTADAESEADADTEEAFR